MHIYVTGIFLLTQTLAKVLAICSTTWKTTKWKIKDNPLYGCKMLKAIAAAHLTVWVTHVDAHSKGPFCDETEWNQVMINSAFLALVPLLSRCLIT